jgi:hypothetical protein
MIELACSSCFNPCCTGCRTGNPIIFCPPVSQQQCDLLCEFAVSENVSTTTPVDPQQTLNTVTITTNDTGDRVLLQGTVEWVPTSPLTSVISTTGLTVNLGVEKTFRIWRDAIGGAGINVYETSDSSSLLNLTLSALVAPVTVTTNFNQTTTSFHFVDQGVPVGTHTYFLTVDGAGVPITTFNRVFTAAEINPNP